MACRLVGTKPLSEPKPGYYQLDPEEQTSVKFYSVLIFSFKKIHLNMSSGKGRPFCLGLNVLIPAWLIVHRGPVKTFKEPNIPVKIAIITLLPTPTFCILVKVYRFSPMYMYIATFMIETQNVKPLFPKYMCLMPMTLIFILFGLILSIDLPLLSNISKRKHLNQLEKSDYTAVRDTPRSGTG